jgi:hypothetical protein
MHSRPTRDRRLDEEEWSVAGLAGRALACACI